MGVAVEVLTHRQAEVLQVLEGYIERFGMPPTVRELMPLIRVSQIKAATDHLQALANKGYIRLHAGRSRGIQILQPAEYGLPLIGRVAAGRPIESVEHVERVVRVPPDLFRRKPDYLLRVYGDSMFDAGIRDGDWIAVRKAETADPGQIVVASLEGEITVKTLNIDNGMVVLVPENPAYQPIRIAPENVNIVGVYVGLIRPDH